MEEKPLIRVSVLCAIAGLAILFYFSNIIGMTVIKIKDITPDDTGIVVRVCGNITYMYVSKSKHVFLKVDDDSARIDVVVFNNTAPKLSGANPYKLKTGDKVCITGRVDIYENGLEIVPADIEVKEIL